MLLSVLGPAGVGKTHLACEAALRLQESSDGPERVVWVDVTGAQTSNHLVEALIVALDAGSQGSFDDLVAVGLEILQSLGASSLLVFDNCEALDASARTMLSGWHTTYGGRWWITSQESLGFPKEHHYLLAPLPCPALDDPPERVRSSPAVQLIETLVRWRRGRFVPNPREIEGLAHLARSLGGLPLALAMAAGRMTLLDAGTVLHRLEQELAFLQQTPTAHNTHHRTLVQALSRSLERLTPQERAVWDVCVCFSGDFSVEAVEGIAEPTQDGRSVLDHLERLEQRFLIQRHGDTVRLVVLSALRRFALEDLAGRGVLHTMLERHATWFAEQGTRYCTVAAQDPNAIDWLLRERANMLGALVFAREQFTQNNAPAGIKLILQLTSALHIAKIRSRTFTLPDDFLETALAMARTCEADLPPRIFAYFLLGLSIERKRQGLFDAFLALIDEALELAKSTSDSFLMAALWSSRGNYLNAKGQLEPAGLAMEQALLFVEHPVNRARLMMNLAVIQMNSGQHTTSVELLEKARDVFSNHGIVASCALAHLNISLAYSVLGYAHKACEHLVQCEACFESIKHVWGQARAANLRLNLCAEFGQCEPLEVLDTICEASRLKSSESGDGVLMAVSLSNHAQIYLERGDDRKALALLHDATQRLESLDDSTSEFIRRNLALAQLRLSPEGAVQTLRACLECPTLLPSSYRRLEMMVGLVLLHSIAGELERATDMQAQIKASFDTSNTVSVLGDACLAFGHAWALDPTSEDAACEPWLERVMDALRTVLLTPHGTTASIVYCSMDVRLVLRHLISFLPQWMQLELWAICCDPEQTHFVVDREGRGFRVSGARWSDLNHRPMLMRLLHALVEQPTGLSTQDLVELLYGDEVLVYESGVNRVHKQLSLLRRAGLKSMIIRHKGMYRLVSDSLMLIPSAHGRFGAGVVGKEVLRPL